MAVAPLSFTPRNWRPGPAATLLGGLGLALAVALALVGPDRLIAQVEGQRGIIPVATSSDIEVSGIEVNTTGKDGQEARLNGWKEAQKKAWAKAGGPAMGEAQIEAMVTAVVIEREQIGPRRYIATLSVVFDRQRAGQYIGDGTSAKAHSAPLLTIPVLYSGGVGQVYEVQGAWQQSWAQFRGGTSPIDYVRPVGAGGESLLVTAGQPGRRSRAWWHTVLDQFNAADVISPVARLERQWPGGPVRGTFTARYGPDNQLLESFTLTANDSAGLPRMLAEAVVRLDQVYTRALAEGKLKPDPTLRGGLGMDAGLAALIARAQEAERAAAAPTPDASASPSAEPSQAAAPTITVQFSSHAAAAVDAALAAVRGAPGVQGAATPSLAMGGPSVMRVTITSDLSALAAALRARGWQVAVGANALSIRR